MTQPELSSTTEKLPLEEIQQILAGLIEPAEIESTTHLMGWENDKVEKVTLGPDVAKRAGLHGTKAEVKINGRFGEFFWITMRSATFVDKVKDTAYEIFIIPTASGSKDEYQVKHGPTRWSEPTESVDLLTDMPDYMFESIFASFKARAEDRWIWRVNNNN